MDINKLITDNNENLSPLSVKTYTSCILKVMEILRTKNMSILINQPDKVIKIVNEFYSNPNSAKTKLASLIVLLRSMSSTIKDSNHLKDKINSAIEKYTEANDGYSKQIKEQLSTNEKNNKESGGWLTDDNINTIKENLKAEIPSKIQTIHDLNKYRNYVIFMLYDEIASRLDIADSKIIFKSNKPLDDTYNYIVLDKKNKEVDYIMNNYKTSKSYGTKNIKLNNSLYPLLLDYKKNVNKFNSDDWFLLNDSGLKLSRSRLSSIYSNLGSSINKKLNVSTNRKMKVSNVIDIDAIKSLADKMGHSINEQISVYAKGE
jgi:hypothetical protein